MPHTTVSRLLAGTPFLTLDLLLLAGILMVLFRRREVFSQNRDPLAPEHSTAIRGLLAVTVVLHHLSLTATHAVLFRIFTLAGIVCVSVFFFYSGYGLMVGLLKKADYLRGFFSRRVLRIAFFYLLSNLVIWYGFQLTHYKYTLSEIQHGLVTGDPFTPYSWYVLTLLILYVLFYICARLFQSPGRILVALAGGVFAYYLMVTSQFSWPSWTVDSCLAFVLGAAAAVYRRQERPFGCRLRLLLPAAAASGVALTLAACIPAFRNWAATGLPSGPLFSYQLATPLGALGINLLCLVAVVLCLRLFHYLSLPEPLFSFLGRISFEIYLYHGLVMRLVRSEVFYVSSDLLYLIAVFAITIPLAWVMHRLGEFLWQVLTRRSWRRVAAVSNT